MNWFKVQIIEKNTNAVIFELPIQAIMHNSVEGRFENFLENNPEYKKLVESIGEYSFRSEHMNHHLERFRQE